MNSLCFWKPLIRNFRKFGTCQNRHVAVLEISWEIFLIFGLKVAYSTFVIFYYSIILLYKWDQIALFFNRAIFCDFKKSFFCCILDTFTLFFMSDRWPSPPRGSKLEFFDILLSKLTKYRWITTFPNSKFKGARVI